MSSLKGLIICYNLKQPSTHKREETMLVTNANYNSNCTALRSINDFNSDEEVAKALRENLRARRGRLTRRRNHQQPNIGAKDAGFPGCLDSEKSITQTVEKELRRLKALKSFEVLDNDTDVSSSSSSSCDSGSSRRGSVSHPVSPADHSYSSRDSSPVAAPSRDLSSTLSTMDTLVDMARRMFRVSKAVITLTDLGREKILAARGMGDLQELKRHLPLNAFTGLCLVEGAEDALAVIKDTSQDPRFASMLPVKDAGFYAGVPLLTPEGERIGVMCILNDQPRPQGLSEGEQQDLRHLAGLAMHALVERRTRLQLEQKLQQATRVVSATCNDLLTPLSAIELAMSLLSDDQDFQGKLSGDQQESVKIATNCVGVLGKLCRGMRDQHSANCTRQVNAVKGLTGPRGVTVRQVSTSDLGLTTESFRIMYGSGETNSDDKDGSSEASKQALPATALIKTSNDPMAPPTTSTIVVQDMVKSIHLAMDAIPKTVPTSIALHASVPSHIVADERKILSCALGLLQRCVSIAVSGSIQLSIKPQYCRCGKAMLEFQCQIRPEGSDSNAACGHKCCSATPGYAFGLEKGETPSRPLLCCHNQKTSSKRLRICSEINLHSVAMQMNDLGGDAGIDRSDEAGPESVRFWFRVPLEEPKSLFEITATASSIKHAVLSTPPTRRLSGISNPLGSETANTGDQVDGELALFMESQPRKRRALIIEDSLVIRKVIANALAKIGIETETAVNGMEGLHQLQGSHYDVVLCDFLMPVMDGLDCVQQYRDWEKENRPFFRQYIIGMSAHASDKDVERGIAAGMDSYKPKPLTYRGLQDIVSACEKNQQKLISDGLAVVNNSETTPKVSEVVASTLYDRSHTKMCLIASRDEVSCSLATKVAVAKDWKCLIVRDGEDALQALQKRNWDACFLDEKLALLSGRKCASEFRKWEQVHRVNLQMNLFILPSPNDGSKDDGAPVAIPPGANGVLQKPLQQKEFEEILEKAEQDQSLHIVMR